MKPHHLPLGVERHARSVLAHAATRQEVVLDPTSDPYARVAVEAYAEACAHDQPWLAEALQRQYRLAGGTPSSAAALWRSFHAAQRQARESDSYDEAAWTHVALHLCGVLGAMNL
ncbi:hypothetical protein HUS70_17580 [Pandoraea nosoerga]|uniref:Uncharacterized protein n=1 Tax=Pandoraea nosoerga TaxID=2508296 RepID=A0A5E4SZA0_9BURK|nr:hypothetical protein [Pandoraea nosoerga]MBN4668247.1 hypothetical protein [Pandoraea nosoerga]MBN4678103.1 hypothetical protein [Pandoraea nosoerga]MBN4679492.1 hypothetical protein [Pandoraea nosoerga]MBN4746421.1 hypothetical protein [Pandoraea nosoerga]VVD80935.1 hypothetical protein PNO31109_01089 [Pandoraea nosoerga]